MKKTECFEVTEEDILQGNMGSMEFNRMMTLAEIALDCREIKLGFYRRRVSNNPRRSHPWEKVETCQE